MSLILRGIAGWFVLLVVAIVNGAARQAWLVPELGERAGHVVSTLTLTALIFGVGWLMSGWLDVASLAEAWCLGALWLFLTASFEFLGGHFIFGTPWSKLVADYNVVAGRIWILVLMVTALTPPIVFKLKR